MTVDPIIGGEEKNFKRRFQAPPRVAVSGACWTGHQQVLKPFKATRLQVVKLRKFLDAKLILLYKDAP
jgi:hypothetical protein